MQDVQLNLRLTKAQHDELVAVAQELGLDKSNTLRFLTREKARALGLSVPSASQADAAAPTSAEP